LLWDNLTLLVTHRKVDSERPGCCEEQYMQTVAGMLRGTGRATHEDAVRTSHRTSLGRFSGAMHALIRCLTVPGPLFRKDSNGDQILRRSGLAPHLLLVVPASLPHLRFVLRPVSGPAYCAASCIKQDERSDDIPRSLILLRIDDVRWHRKLMVFPRVLSSTSLTITSKVQQGRRIKAEYHLQICPKA
jgi:hypothetical protein